MRKISKTKTLKSVKNVTKLFLCSLILIVWSPRASFGQNKKSLKVGDKAPSLNAINWIKGDPVSEFKNGQIYVIEFGATWCGPCKTIIPKLTELQKKYKEDLSVLGFFVMEINTESTDVKEPKYVKIVENYVDKIGDKMQYTVGIDGPSKTMELNWLRAAGFNGLPQTFVIDKQGYIAWIGHDMGKLNELVEKMVKGEYELQMQIEFDQANESKVIANENRSRKFLYSDENYKGDYLFKSVLAKYIGDRSDWKSPEYIWGYSNSKQDFDSRNSHGIIAMPLVHLYSLAYGDTLSPNPWYNKLLKQLVPTSYGKYWRKVIIETDDDDDDGNQNKYWGQHPDTWNYLLSVPKSRATARFLQGAMRRDFKTYFGHEVIVEIRKMPYWKFTATQRARENLNTKTPGASMKFIDMGVDKTIKWTNVNMQFLVYQMWLNHQWAPPFIDETGIEGDIDIEFSGSFSDLNDAIKGFAKIGITLEKAEKEMKVIVIRDPKGDCYSLEQIVNE